MRISIQCYDPNNSPTAVMNITNTTIRAYTTAATAGLFVADSYALDLHVTNVTLLGRARWFARPHRWTTGISVHEQRLLLRRRRE